jgi:peroxiredoxin
LRLSARFEKVGAMRSAAVILFLCLFAVFSFAVKTELRREKSPVAALKIHEPMPDFELPDVSGKAVKLSEVIRDKKIVMINFWATWCGPCRIEMPGFEKLYNEQKNNGFVILAIAEDRDWAKLDQYLKQKPVSFPVLVDKDNALLQKLKIESFPTTVLIGADGKIRRVEEGVAPYLEFFVREALEHPERK